MAYVCTPLAGGIIPPKNTLKQPVSVVSTGMRFPLAAILALCALVPLRAEVVVLTNGDRITGSVVKLENGKLTLKSEYAGVIVLPWEAVASLSGKTALNFALNDGQLVVGAPSLKEGRLQILTASAGAVDTGKEIVKTIRSKEEQLVYDTEMDRYRNPRLVDLWAGFVDLGFARAQGNARTGTVSVSANASRVTSRDKIGVYFTSLNASSNIGGKSLTTANAMRGGVGYNLNVSPKAFAFAFTDLEFDEFQSLDLRFAPAGGLGYHVYKGESLVFDLSGGAGLNKEFFSTGLRRTSGEALAGEELIYKLSGAASLRQKMTIYPNLTDRGDYRLNFDMSAVTAIRKWLGWQFTVSNRLLSNPAPGRKRNDILVTTGVRLTFAK